MIDEDEELIEDEPPAYAVLLRKLQSWSFQDVAQILQLEADLPLADATRIAKKRPGILLGGQSQETARAVVKALRAIGVDCFLVPEHEIFEPPSPVHLESMELLADGIRGVIAASDGMDVAAPWTDIALLAVARISGAVHGGEMHLAAKRRPTGSLTQRPSVLAFAPQVKKGAYEALAIHVGFLLSDERMLLHVDSQAFDFGCLGPRRTNDRVENLVRLLDVVAQKASRATLTPGTIAARDGGRTLDQHVHLTDFHDECLWRLDLMELERRKREKGGV